MPQDAPLNGSALDLAEGPWSRVAGMQAKLHRWRRLIPADTARRGRSRVATGTAV